MCKSKGHRSQVAKRTNIIFAGYVINQLNIQMHIMRQIWVAYLLLFHFIEVSPGSQGIQSQIDRSINNLSSLIVSFLALCQVQNYKNAFKPFATMCKHLGGSGVTGGVVGRCFGVCEFLSIHSFGIRLRDNYP